MWIFRQRAAGNTHLQYSYCTRDRPGRFAEDYLLRHSHDLKSVAHLRPPTLFSPSFERTRIDSETIDACFLTTIAVTERLRLSAHSG